MSYEPLHLAAAPRPRATRPPLVGSSSVRVRPRRRRRRGGDAVVAGDICLVRCGLDDDRFALIIHLPRVAGFWANFRRSAASSAADEDCARWLFELNADRDCKRPGKCRERLFFSAAGG